MFRARRLIVALSALLAVSCAVPVSDPAPGPTAPAQKLPQPTATSELPFKARSEIDLSELALDTQKRVQQNERTRMVWWIPEQYWDQQLQLQKSPDSMIVAMREAVRPYVVVFAVDVAVGPKLVGKPEEVLRSTILLRDSRGRAYKPLPWSDVTPGVIGLLSTIKPLLGSIMGALGENFHPFVFSATDPEGNAIADPLAAGDFTIEIADARLAFDLPLAALLAPRQCPIDSAQFSGTYRFCPIHGVELVNP